jgi:hypothetical protein
MGLDFGSRKISLQDLSPMTWAEHIRIKKNYRCITYSPMAGEERDSDKRTMGGG